MGITRQARGNKADDIDVQERHLVEGSSSGSDTPSSEESAGDGVGGAPDGKWGWMIVFSVFMSSFLVDGCIGSFGIIYPELLSGFGAGPSLTSLAGSIIVAMFLMSCLIAGVLLRRFSCRRVCLAGGCITTIGFVLSSISRDIFTFIVTYGVLGGIGIGMNHLAGNVLVNMYFEKKRGLACGIVSSGSGFGLFALALTTESLLQQYGWRGTMLISAGIMFHFCVFACLLRPVEHTTLSKKKKTSDAGTHDNSDNTQSNKPLLQVNKAAGCRQTNNINTPAVQCVLENTESAKTSNFQSLVNITHGHGIVIQNSHLISLPDLSGSKTSAVNVRYRNFGHSNNDHLYGQRNINPFLRKDILYSGSLCHVKEYRESDNLQTFVPSMSVIHSEDEQCSDEGFESIRTPPKSTGLCDLALFKNGVFIPILVGGVLLQMGQFIPSTFIPEYCKTIGLTGSDGSVIISIYGAVNIVGRLSAGCLANLRCVDSLWLCNFGAFMCAVCCCLFPLCDTFHTLVAFAVGFGYFVGYSCPLQYIIMVEYLGLSKLTPAMGILQMCKGPAALVGPPLAGAIYEWTQDYTMTVVFAGGIFLLATAAQSLVPCTNRCFSANTDRIEIKVEV